MLLGISPELFFSEPEGEWPGSTWSASSSSPPRRLPHALWQPGSENEDRAAD